MGSLLFFEFMYLPLEKCKNDLLNPGGSYSKESTCNVGDLGSIPGLGRSPGGGHGKPLQFSWLENPQEQRKLHATANEIAKSRTQLSD